MVTTEERVGREGRKGGSPGNERFLGQVSPVAEGS